MYVCIIVGYLNPCVCILPCTEYPVELSQTKNSIHTYTIIIYSTTNISSASLFICFDILLAPLYIQYPTPRDSTILLKLREINMNKTFNLGQRKFHSHYIYDRPRPSIR